MFNFVFFKIREFGGKERVASFCNISFSMDLLDFSRKLRSNEADVISNFRFDFHLAYNFIAKNNSETIRMFFQNI